MVQERLSSLEGLTFEVLSVKAARSKYGKLLETLPKGRGDKESEMWHLFFVTKIKRVLRSAIVVLVSRESIPIGALYAHLEHYDDSTFEMGIRVLPEYRGRGIAKKLVRIGLKNLPPEITHVNVISDSSLGDTRAWTRLMKHYKREPNDEMGGDRVGWRRFRVRA